LHSVYIESHQLDRTATLHALAYCRNQPCFLLTDFSRARSYTPAFLRHRQLGSSRRHSSQYAESPPSSGIAAPVIHHDSSDAKNTASSAASAGLPMRPSGMVAARAARRASPSVVAGKSSATSSVSTIEGHMQLTRMFS